MTGENKPQDEIERLHRTVESLRAELLTVYDELALLHSLGAKLGRLANEDQIAAVALQEALEVTQADSAWVILWDGEQGRIPEGCCRGIEPENVDLITRAVLEPLRGRNKRQALSNAFPEEWRLEQASAPARFLASSLSAGGEGLGYLCLGRSRQGRIFTTADQKLIDAVTALAAVALENVRLQRSELEKSRLEGELALARGVQRSLAPSDFECCDFLQSAGISVPCYEVGGDYFDLLPLGPDECLLVMADVAGKGPAAALQAAVLQGMVYASARPGLELPPLMQTINECLRRRVAAGNYATLFTAILDRAGRLRYSNGGHNPPLWIRQEGEVIQLTEGGPLMGLLENAGHRQGEVRMTPGDLLLLYTDGITEAENPRGETWGLPCLLDWAGRQRGGTPEEAQRSLLEAVGAFCGGRRQADDLTVLVVRFAGTA
ncbi:MAG: SpoIIE family protein phosphatase [Acidobacteria bacterium]|nr:SpoIIE family protein phosphatase [Acidobacteriota bacterium]